jgi:hypothetical protein
MGRRCAEVIGASMNSFDELAKLHARKLLCCDFDYLQTDPTIVPRLPTTGEEVERKTRRIYELGVKRVQVFIGSIQD